MTQDNNKYTKPELRERIKNRVMEGSKGGKPGQWSARKAQLVAQEYKEAGGGYKGGKGEKQKDLEKWGKEKWMTKDEYEKRNKAKTAAKKYQENIK
jgi:UTP:GlnB (protein PII) uridylyltransferase